MKGNKQLFKHLNKLVLVLILISSCQNNQETISPVRKSITTSVYASGVVESENQYQVYATVNGIVNEIITDEDSEVEIGTPIISIVNDAQKIQSDNAKLNADFNDYNFNVGKLEEAKSVVVLTKIQMENDALMLKRQKNLWTQNVGTKIELEQREIAFKSSSNNYASAKEKQSELEKQLSYLSKQAQNNRLISNKTTDDYLIKSKVKGKIYQMNLAKGEIVNPQIPIAIIGDDSNYLLKMQVDEYDIVSIKLGMSVFVVLNSYKDSVFKAVVTKINPIMNVQSKTFTIEAKFVKPPLILYPNISFEANVVLQTKKNALLIPRSYLSNDSTVINKSGKNIPVKIGLKDLQMAEILSGIDENDELIMPKQ
ncbi:RND transporter [Pedobacter psychrophilus]|uniref:RND transporter n=1 Tax=Pedobacter psychrophilus TaxID=1826909 RepID=A0A179DMM9_9SPHI|nr:efflux RND transporter periplasmic adaptor subunit [Pedobacter psychrophilus]OAQ42301.1 RND transporter [Pedobacter psychrophilus]